MNLYDVLRLIITKIPLPEAQVTDCLKVIDETEKWNALGSTVKAMDVEGHAHRYPPMSNVCDLCGRARNQ